MEVLIFSCSTGGGHNMAGRAVQEALEARGHHVIFMDPYDLKDHTTAEVVGGAYTRLVQAAPKAFGTIYWLGEQYRKLPVASPVFEINKLMAKRVTAYLTDHPFDAVVMTHPFPGHIMTHVRKQMGRKTPRTIQIATDYTCIPFIEEAICDEYVIPSVELTDEFLHYGFSKEKIRPYGIPIAKGFTKDLTQTEARKKLHLSEANRYILLAGGSIGAGKIDEAAHVIDEFLEENEIWHLIIITGSNEKLRKSLFETYGHRHNMTLLTQTDQMPVYLKACDVFISKPGGLSSTEAAAAGIPLVHITPIPGCETKNTIFFEQRGMSMPVWDPKEELLPALYALKNRETAEIMIKQQKKYIDGKAADKICDLLEKR